MTESLPFVRKEAPIPESEEQKLPTSLSMNASAKHALNRTSQRLILECSPVVAMDALAVLMANIIELSQLQVEAERTISHTNAYDVTTKFILRRNLTGFSIKVKE